MAQPIGPTPVLTGREAARFLTKIHTEEGNLVGPTPTPKLAKVQKLIREHGKRRQKHV